jgi:hypothetical protein
VTGNDVTERKEQKNKIETRFHHIVKVRVAVAVG